MSSTLHEVPNDMCIQLTVDNVVSLHDERNWVYHTYMNHNVNVCSLLLHGMKGNFVVILVEGHPGLK